MSGTPSPSQPAISIADERYGHQLVAPSRVVAHVDPNWQERCYHLLFSDDGLMLDMGRSVWPVEGVRRAFAGASDGVRQAVVRVEAPIGPGEDADAPDVEDLVVETVRPLEEIRLTLGAPGDGLALDLTYTARFPPVATAPLRVEQEGRVVTDYMNFFQSGTYDGWVDLAGVRHLVTARHGFRDRGWGLRKHEGMPRRGLVLAGFCELPGEALYFLLFETASGRRVMTNGWRITPSGVDPVVTVEHDMAFSDGLLTGGTVRAGYASGTERRIVARARSRLFLAGVGYSADPRFKEPGREVFDVADPAVRELLRGQTDHGCEFDVDGVAGHGYVETGLGIHARYRPQP